MRVIVQRLLTHFWYYRLHYIPFAAVASLRHQEVCCPAPVMANNYLLDDLKYTSMIKPQAQWNIPIFIRRLYAISKLEHLHLHKILHCRSESHEEQEGTVKTFFHVFELLAYQVVWFSFLEQLQHPLLWLKYLSHYYHLYTTIYTLLFSSPFQLLILYTHKIKCISIALAC